MTGTKRPRSHTIGGACVVCLEDLEEAATCTYACGHRFHSTCIQIWLGENTTCPTCRAAIGPCEHSTHSFDIMTAVVDHLRTALVVARRDIQTSLDELFVFQQELAGELFVLYEIQRGLATE